MYGYIFYKSWNHVCHLSPWHFNTSLSTLKNLSLLLLAWGLFLGRSSPLPHLRLSNSELSALHWLPESLGKLKLQLPTVASCLVIHPLFYPCLSPHSLNCYSLEPPKLTTNTWILFSGKSKPRYDWFSLFAVVLTYKITTTMELANPEPWLWDEIQDWVPVSF